ncbi:MAG: hypothetical protein EOP18_03130 [Rhizobiaceae bacterium]|nr:MAG: hypothetical protein EOP18_03130 [Rhizobiaceae bacterium]
MDVSDSKADEAQSMGDAFRTAANQTEEQQLAQIDGYLAHMRTLGYDRIDGPILQMAKSTMKSGRRDEMCDILRNFRPIVEPEEGALMFGYFPDVDEADVIHCIQVYEDWDALCHHMREPRYMQYVDPIMSIAAPGSPEYSYGSCLFMHRGNGHGGKQAGDAPTNNKKDLEAAAEGVMGDVYRSIAKMTEEEQFAQIEGHLDHMASLGYDKIDGPILQLAKATALPGRRPELLEVLKRFQPIVEGEVGTLMYGHFPDVDHPDVIHSMQVYEDWDALCAHMRDIRYNQFVTPIMGLAAPGSPEYHYGSCLFMHRGKGHKLQAG